VYGGGGIMPDHFIPWDTSYNSSYYNSLLRNSIMREFALDYYNQHKRSLEKMKWEDYRDNFIVDETMLNAIISKGKKSGVEFVEADFETSKKLIQTIVKATLARNIWDREKYYPIINELNETFIAALDYFDEAEQLAKK
jgi:carboxyl-terminal processing protease